MKQDLEQRIWLPVVFFIIGFLVTELPLISQLNAWQDRADFAERAHQYLMGNFFTPNVMITVIVACVAVVSALSGFIYMHSAKKLDVYHSIPIKREMLFLQQYVYGVLYYVIPMLVHVVLCIAICAANGALGMAVLGQALGFYLVELLIYLACYSVVIVAVCLTGNLVISVLGSAILLVYSLLLVLLKSGLMNTFFETYYGSDAYALTSIPAFSPVHLICNMIMDMSEGSVEYLVYTNHVGFYGKLIFAAVVYTLFALFLYKKRPTEVAGKTMAFPITEPIVKTMVVFPTAIVSGYLFTGIISNNGDFVWFLFGCIFGFVIICPLMEIIFRKDMKAVFSHPLQIAFNGVCVIGAVLILQFDLLGYDSYVPDEDKVESYAIDFGALDSIYSGYGDTYDYRFENMTITDNESTRKLLEHAAEFTRPLRRGELEAETEAGKVYSSYLEVKYNLKNGKSVYRSYLVNLADEQVMQWVADTYNDMQHKLGVYPVLSENREENYIGVLLECAYASEKIPLSEEKMQRFVDAYRRELTNLSFEEMHEQYPVAKLSFALREPEEEVTYPVVAEQSAAYYTESNFKYYAEEHGYMIYPSFTQTLALLEEYGAELVSEIPAEDVIEIKITDYSREANDNDGLNTKVVEVNYNAENGQLAEIGEIIPTLVDNQFLNRFKTSGTIEDYMEVYVTYIYDDMEMRNYMNFKKGEVPGFVLEDIENVF